MNTMNPIYTDNIRKSLSPNLTDFLITCTFGLGDCKEDDFDWYYDLMYGNCFTFNNGRNFMGQNVQIRSSSQAGMFFGFKFQLYVGNPLNVDKQIQSSGVHIFIHNRTNKPHYYEGVDVSIGEQTNIIIKKEFYSKLGPPYSDCISNLDPEDASHSFFYKSIFKSNRRYNQKDCFDLCQQKDIIMKCKCYNPFFIKLDNVKACEYVNEIICALNETVFYFRENNNCSISCPSDCDNVVYSLSTTHSDFPNPNYAEYLKKIPMIQAKFLVKNNFSYNSRDYSNNSINIDYNVLKRSISSISIFYEDLRYTKISQIPKMSFEDLLSNVGGTLGLFIGISFLSFVEILDALIQMFFILLEKKSKIQTSSY